MMEYNVAIAFYLQESDFRIDELLFHEKIAQPPRRKHLPTPELSHKVINTFSSRPKGRHTGSPAHSKRPHQARLAMWLITIC